MQGLYNFKLAKKETVGNRNAVPMENVMNLGSWPGCYESQEMYRNKNETVLREVDTIRSPLVKYNT